jgi:hypothetical protein
MGVTLSGLVLVLVLVAVTLGSSGAMFPVLMAAAAVVGIAALYILRVSGQSSDPTHPPR